jgi:hypothetical protein
MTSSLYGPDELGYTCATKVTTEGTNGASRRESIKVTLVRIVL